MRRFKRAQAQNQMSIERHLVANASLDSSEDEEETNEEDTRDMLGKVLSAYQGDNVDTEKTIAYLINIFQSGGAVCLICISSVKKADAIWNCSRCFSFMHLSCILHWIRDSLAYKHDKGITPVWGCPKCRTEYGEDVIPRSYECFCKKATDPPYQPWSIPHSCGETCGKLLQPECGHRCVLLCHPGPCPPCAKTVLSGCFCGKQMPQPKRCKTKGWSCGAVCSKIHKRCSHECNELCHSGECPPCSKVLSVKCHCNSKEEARLCHEAFWKCDKPCGNQLPCNVHTCTGTCHLPEDCGSCPFEKNRTCPCGKKRYAISCKQQQVPPCGDTCGKLLDCGSHFCNMRCHTDRCGQCLEVVTKSCRCSSYRKEVACGKEFHCSKKCTQMRLCGRHTCNRKCCDCLIKNTSNVCEKVCDNTLNCRKHKCSAPCHSGPCYPCERTDVIQCRCGSSKIVVPCGTVKRIRPPPCNKFCKIPPICHHSKRETHKCHQGPCPPCKKVCGLTHKRCGHTCPAVCHTKVWVKVNVNGTKTQLAGPWEKQKDVMQLKTLPCPPCEVSVPVTCLGGHETRPLPCHASRSTSCGRVCGQMLPCTNHICELLCHKIKKDENNGTECMDCEKPCIFPRPNGCTHKCPQPCHPAPCPTCQQLVRISCHCGIGTLYRRCVDLTSATVEERNVLLKCGNQCPKNYSCGHRCIDTCHPGPCKSESECNKKIKLFCKCKRIKKEFLCLLVQKKEIVVECDEVCQRVKEEKNKALEITMARKKQEEEIKNQEEIQKFERKFKPRRKGKDKFGNRKSMEEDTRGRYKIILVFVTVIVAVIAVTIYVIVPSLAT